MVIFESTDTQHRSRRVSEQFRHAILFRGLSKRIEEQGSRERFITLSEITGLYIIWDYWSLQLQVCSFQIHCAFHHVIFFVFANPKMKFTQCTTSSADSEGRCMTLVLPAYTANLWKLKAFLKRKDTIMLYRDLNWSPSTVWMKPVSE